MKILIVATAVATLATAPLAFAAPGGNGGGNGHGPAHGGKAKGAAHVQTLPVVTATKVEGGWAVNGAGVATNPGGKTMSKGLPPGQLKKMNRTLAVGSVLSPRYPGYQVLSRTTRYNLAPAPSGYQYVRVGDDAYLRQTSTGTISRVIENLFR